MKKIALLISLILSISAFAQPKSQNELTAKTYLLSHTIFGTKDSTTLENLFAKTLSYGHSHGNVQTRQEALKSITTNKSTYTDTSITNITHLINGKTAITRYFFKANENKVNGTISKLDFAMVLVWVKEKRNWKLLGRQAAYIAF
jgi:predicted Zn-dependent peptidase